MDKMILVNKFRTDIIRDHGTDASSAFMDELEKWDRTVRRSDLFNMFYSEDVLLMLFERLKTYTIVLLNKGIVLKKVVTKSLMVAEDAYYKFCCLQSVRAGYNTAKMEIELNS